MEELWCPQGWRYGSRDQTRPRSARWATDRGEGGSSRVLARLSIQETCKRWTLAGEGSAVVGGTGLPH